MARGNWQSNPKCRGFLYFVSQEAVLSANCRKEVGLADKQQIPTIAIHLEYTELPAGLDLILSDRQAILKYEVPKQEYQQKLQARISSYLDQPTIQPVVVKRKETVPILTGPDNSIAVLPFVNMSSDPEQEFFSDGITEEILNSLASVAELQVTGRTSSFAFKGKNDDLRHIGVALGVKYILEGSVRKSGIKVRITAQLINVENGFRLWSDTFDRELTDIFAIQDEIASKILVQLKSKLLNKEIRVRKNQRTDSEVYELYLLAKQRIYNRTQKSIESVVELLDKAIATDPDFAPVHAQRGIALLLLSEDKYGTLPIDEALQKGKHSINTALTIDDGLAEAWTGLGLYHIGGRENRQAIEALTKAVSLNPNLLDANLFLSNALNGSGDIAGALQVLDKILAIDPMFSSAMLNAVAINMRLGMDDRAQASIDRFRALAPTSPVVSHANAVKHIYSRKYAKAMRLAEQLFRQDPTYLHHFWYSQCLLCTMQIEKLAEEGVDLFQVDALDMLGRSTEAYDIAHEVVERSSSVVLFRLLNRSGRSNEVVAYIKEHYPNLRLLEAQKNLYGEYWLVMAEVAFAYHNSNDAERFHEALQLLEKFLTSLSAQGVDNWAMNYANAQYLTLAGKNEDAFTQLEIAYERGMMPTPTSKWCPIFTLLGDAAKLTALDSAVNIKLNAEREKLGLEPIDPSKEFWQ